MAQPAARRRTDTTSLLPPCKICGDRGSGFHYGVNTCNSCKAFFQRAQVKTSWPACKRTQQCRNATSRHLMCATCRYQRCVDCGMSKSAIKMGRYTAEKQTLDTEEVKQLQIQAKISSSERRLLSGEDRVEELNNLISSITTSHITHGVPREFFSDLQERENRYTEFLRFKEALFGQLNPLTFEEYEKIYEETGLDIDGRRQMMHTFLPALEISVKQLIMFVKTLPGFTCLPVSDQILMIKDSLYDCDALSYYHTYNRDAHLWGSPYLADCFISCSDLSVFYKPHTLQLYITCIVKLQDLDLTPEEQALLLSLAVAYTDAALTPEGHKLVLSMQEVVSDALYQLVCRTHDQPDRFFAKLVSALLMVKDCCTRCMLDDSEVLKQFRKLHLCLPETVKELFFDPIS